MWTWTKAGVHKCTPFTNQFTCFHKEYESAFNVSTLSTNEQSSQRAAAGRKWKNKFRKSVRAIVFNPTCASIIYIHWTKVGNFHKTENCSDARVVCVPNEQFSQVSMQGHLEIYIFTLCNVELKSLNSTTLQGESFVMELPLARNNNEEHIPTNLMKC